MKPIYIHSGMSGAPQYANANDNINGILEACLINGFNTKTASSASASGGVLTLNFGTNPGFEALQTVEVAVADVAMVNGQHRVVANANNQVTIDIPGLPDGAVGSTGAGITIKQAGAGWSKPFSASTKAVFRPAAGNRRFLRVVNAAGVDTQARGYEDMTDVDTGTGPFPTAAQVPTPLIINNIGYGSVANSPWWLVATSKWVYFSLTQSLTLASQYSVGSLFFGDLANVTVTADAYATVLRLSNGANYSPRNYAGASGAIAITSRDSVDGSAAWPSVIADGQRFIPYVPMMEPNSLLRGVYPNVYKCYPQIPNYKFQDIYSNVASTTSRIKPVSAALTSVMTFAIAIDDEAWD
jgi:hypothetical protein